MVDLDPQDDLGQSPSNRVPSGHLKMVKGIMKNIVPNLMNPVGAVPELGAVRNNLLHQSKPNSRTNIDSCNV